MLKEENKTFADTGSKMNIDAFEDYEGSSQFNTFQYPKICLCSRVLIADDEPFNNIVLEGLLN